MLDLCSVYSLFFNSFLQKTCFLGKHRKWITYNIQLLFLNANNKAIVQKSYKTDSVELFWTTTVF